MPTRSLALDVSRGLAILGVLGGHALIGLKGSGLIPPGSWAMTAHEFLAVGRMSAMFFLVGLFIPGAVRRRETAGRSYLRERLTFLLWVYLVWYVIQALFEVIGSPWKNQPVEPTILVTPWVPLAHLWFLPVLALGTAVVVCTRSWERTWLLAPLGILSVLFWPVTVPVIGLDGVSNVFFVAAGAAVGRERVARWLARPVLMTAVAILALVVYSIGYRLGAVDTRVPFPLDFPTAVVSLVTVLFGITALLAASSGIAAWTGPVGRILGWIGQNTLEIYCSHIIILAGLRIVLMAAGMDEPVTLFLITTIAALAAAILLARWAPRLHLGWLFAPPARLARWSTAPVSSGRARRSRPAR